MKTNWQSYLELTERLLRWNDLCLEEALIKRAELTEEDGKYVRRGFHVEYAATHACVYTLLSWREVLLRELGIW